MKIIRFFAPLIELPYGITIGLICVIYAIRQLIIKRNDDGLSKGIEIANNIINLLDKIRVPMLLRWAYSITIYYLYIVYFFM